VTTLRHAVRASLQSGAYASLLSTVALVVMGKTERNNGAIPLNAVSHWIWGDGAMRERDVSLRHTLLGYGIHHGASIFWAIFYEKLCGGNVDRKSIAWMLSEPAAIAALACVVDYRLTPKRFRPGFEQSLSKPALFVAYLFFALGLSIPALVKRAGRTGNGTVTDRKRGRRCKSNARTAIRQKRLDDAAERRR
jgi:hypothetical protein